MIAVGIPSYNEADNISDLVTKIDEAAVILDIPIIIINADNNSPDNTSDIFKNTETKSQKISIISKKPGKGSNVFSIFDEVLRNPEISYLFLIDADIKSFEHEWLKKHHEQNTKGSDYVLPSYKRKYIEGNGTNHFAYPVMRALLNGEAPKQPIAGDIGLSRGFIKYLNHQQRPESSYGYGIDMFISIHAVSYEGRITEIDLEKKIHKPSFPKMIKIFLEEASSYYFVRSLKKTNKATFTSYSPDFDFLDSEEIPSMEIKKRLEEAKEFHDDYSLLNDASKKYFFKGELDLDEWVDVLVAHENMLGKKSHDQIARSLLPFYLLRVITYLKKCKNPVQAKEFIINQAHIIESRLNQL